MEHDKVVELLERAKKGTFLKLTFDPMTLSAGRAILYFLNVGDLVTDIDTELLLRRADDTLDLESLRQNPIVDVVATEYFKPLAFAHILGPLLKNLVVIF